MKLFVRWGQAIWSKQPRGWWLAAVLGALGGIAAGQAWKGSVSIVDGSSMAPTYQPGARVFTVAITTPLYRGDILLIDDGSGGYALKRLVGLPGETVHLWRGYVFVNRKMLRELYLPKYTFTFPDERTGVLRFELGPDDYLVLGDNRTYSVDSRSYGPIHFTQIKGRVPLPENTPRAKFAPYTLPEKGKTTIRSIRSNPEPRLATPSPAAAAGIQPAQGEGVSPERRGFAGPEA